MKFGWNCGYVWKTYLSVEDFWAAGRYEFNAILSILIYSFSVWINSSKRLLFRLSVWLFEDFLLFGTKLFPNWLKSSPVCWYKDTCFCWIEILFMVFQLDHYFDPLFKSWIPWNGSKTLVQSDFLIRSKSYSHSKIPKWIKMLTPCFFYLYFLNPNLHLIWMRIIFVSKSFSSVVDFSQFIFYWTFARFTFHEKTHLFLFHRVETVFRSNTVLLLIILLDLNGTNRKWPDLY